MPDPDTITENGVTLTRRGSMGPKDYVVTNVDIPAVSDAASEALTSLNAATNISDVKQALINFMESISSNN